MESCIQINLYQNKLQEAQNRLTVYILAVPDWNRLSQKGVSAQPPFPRRIQSRNRTVHPIGEYGITWLLSDEYNVFPSPVTPMESRIQIILYQNKLQKAQNRLTVYILAVYHTALQNFEKF